MSNSNLTGTLTFWDGTTKIIEGIKFLKFKKKWETPKDKPERAFKNVSYSGRLILPRTESLFLKGLKEDLCGKNYLTLHRKYSSTKEPCFLANLSFVNADVEVRKAACNVLIETFQGNDIYNCIDENEKNTFCFEDAQVVQTFVLCEGGSVEYITSVRTTISGGGGPPVETTTYTPNTPQYIKEDCLINQKEQNIVDVGQDEETTTVTKTYIYEKKCVNEGESFGQIESFDFVETVGGQDCYIRCVAYDDGFVNEEGEYIQPLLKTGRSLNDIILSSITALPDCNVSGVCSNFFGINPDGTNPMNSFYIFASEKLQNIRIHHLSDVVKWNVFSQGATGEQLCKEFSVLVAELYKWFRVKHDFVLQGDGSYKLILEHESYFVDQKPIIDIATGKSRKTSIQGGRLKTKKDEIPKAVILKASQKSTTEFYEETVSFDDNCTGDSEEKNESDCFITDVFYALSEDGKNKLDIENQFVMIAATPVIKNGVIGGYQMDYRNETLTPENLVKNLHSFCGDFSTGTLSNGEVLEYKTTKANIGTTEKIRLKMQCLDMLLDGKTLTPFDPNRRFLFSDCFEWGTVESACILSNDTLELKLCYSNKQLLDTPRKPIYMRVQDAYYNPIQMFDFVDSLQKQAHNRSDCCDEKDCYYGLKVPCGQMPTFQLSFSTLRQTDSKYVVEIFCMDGSKVKEYVQTPDDPNITPFFEIDTEVTQTGQGEVTKTYLTSLGIPNEAFELPICKDYYIKVTFQYSTENGESEICRYSLLPFNVVASDRSLHKVSYYNDCEYKDGIKYTLNSGKTFVQCLYLESACSFECIPFLNTTYIGDDVTGERAKAFSSMENRLEVIQPLISYRPLHKIIKNISNHSHVTFVSCEGTAFECLVLEDVEEKTDLGKKCLFAVEKLTFFLT